jgi:hypothetical protein
MFKRRNWRAVLVAAAVVVGLTPAPSFSIVESTETEGAVSPNVSGVWLVISYLQFPNASPTPEGAAAGPSPAASPAPGRKAGAEQTGKNETATRTFNVVNLLKITHLGKEGARALREEEERREQASVAKAKEIIADEQKKSNSIPVQTETGEVEGQAKVIVPTVPPKRQISTEDYFDVSLIDVDMPKDIQDSVDQAQKADKPWVPSAKQLAELKSSWSTLKTKAPSEYGKIEWKVTSADKYDDNLQTDEQTKGSKFVISGNEEMIPKPGVPKTNVLVFGVRKIQPDVLEGGHVRAMMATAPFPLPIEMKGTFKMYKVTELPNGHAAPAAAKSPTPKKK